MHKQGYWKSIAIFVIFYNLINTIFFLFYKYFTHGSIMHGDFFLRILLTFCFSLIVASIVVPYFLKKQKYVVYITLSEVDINNIITKFNYVIQKHSGNIYYLKSVNFARNLFNLGEDIITFSIFDNYIELIGIQKNINPIIKYLETYHKSW